MPSACSRFAPGGRIVALLRQQDAEVVKALGQTFVLRPEDRASDRERLFEQRLRLVEHAEPPIDPAHHRQHLGLQLGLSDELFLHPLDAGVEQAAHGRFPPCRAGRDTDRRPSAGR